MAKKTVCFTLACQGMTALCCPTAACSPTDVHTSCLPAEDTPEAHQFPAKHTAMEEEAAGLVVSGDSGATCVHMNLENKPEEVPEDVLRFRCNSQPSPTSKAPPRTKPEVLTGHLEASKVLRGGWVLPSAGPKANTA